MRSVRSPRSSSSSPSAPAARPGSRRCRHWRSRTSSARCPPETVVNGPKSEYNQEAVRDPRIDEYARLLVERSVGVRPGWEVLIRSTPLARPLIEAVCERIAHIGAYPLLQLAWEPTSGSFAREAPLDVLRVPSPTMTFVWQNCNAFIMIAAPENQ